MALAGNLFAYGLRTSCGPVSDFTLAYDGFEPAEEGLREALTSTGNGYFCTRGAAEWEDARRRALPGDLRPRRLQPRDDRSWAAGRCSTRTW